MINIAQTVTQRSTRYTYMYMGNPKTRLTLNILLKTSSHFVLVCVPFQVSHHLLARCGYTSAPRYKSDMYGMCTMLQYRIPS